MFLPNQNVHQNRFDLRIGVGYLFLGSVDFTGVSFDNEINYHINHYFTTSASINMGRSIGGASDGTASFIGGTINLFLSPFKNNKLNNLRIGGGFAFYNIADVYVSGIHYTDGMVHKDYTSSKETTIGGSIIIEDPFNINNRFLAGMKVFMKPYANGDINSGIMIKFDVKL